MNRTLNLLAFVTFVSALFIRSTDPVVPQIAAGLGVEPATAALLSIGFHAALRAGAAAARRARRYVQQGAADAALPHRRHCGDDRLRFRAEL